MAYNQNNAVLVQGSPSFETSPLSLHKRDSNVAKPYPLLISTISLCFAPKRIVSFKMEGPSMTFVIHHDGLFKTCEDGEMELGYIEAGNCWWKIPGVPISSGLKKLETDADLLAMCMDCRRNRHLINIYFENCISQPCVVDNMRKDVVLLESGSSKKKKSSSQAKKHHSQPIKSPTTMHP
ncbi:hypothetical protein Ahy_A06g026659 [Arachis hypogaea]|uniref:PB1-like domain-containing protein n=1 Tax=Arachis hypogaea TaxID=3818 RepID=A0A445CLB8_ARAHY|nr:hypothetical protein Ahy_A06g026659 [Arachis hypogaea]